MATSKTVLTVEDESILAFTLEDMLADLGYAFAGNAATVAQALDMIARCDPDIIVLDVNLRGERSYTVAAELSRRNKPFVFATGYGGAEHPDEYSGAITLTKPFTVTDLARALETAGAAIG